MILEIIMILAILFIALKIERLYKIPSPLIIVLLTIGAIFIKPNFLSFTDMEFFAEEMLTFVVLLVLVDAFVIKYEDLRKNKWSLMYLAGVAVILSISSGVFLMSTFFAEYQLSLGTMIVLFAMVLATDPVSVVSTFKQYPKLPHKIKFIAEGESLFNDAVALIAFLAFGIYMLQGNELTSVYVVTITTKMILLSVVVGLIVGGIGLSIMTVTKDIKTELVLILLIAYGSFEIAELFHVSGLLAEIVAVVVLTLGIDKSFEAQKKLVHSKEIEEEMTKITKVTKTKEKLKGLFLNVTDIKRQEDILAFLTILAMFVNAVLFISLTKIIEWNNLILYWKEIVIIFLMTTLIRMVMMGKFVFLSKKIDQIEKIDLKSYFILVFAGIKGGLSIVMLNMLNHLVPNFKHFDMFVAIVSGVILLSMFIYVIGLTLTIKLNEKSFEEEYLKEKH